jgi:hypothetical protein
VRGTTDSHSAASASRTGPSGTPASRLRARSAYSRNTSVARSKAAADRSSSSASACSASSLIGPETSSAAPVSS